MIVVQPQYLTDNRGNKISAVIPIKQFKTIIEELEDIKLYDTAHASKEISIPIDKAFKMIEAKRKKLK